MAKNELDRKINIFVGLVIQEYGYRGLPNQGAAFAGFQNKAVKARPGPRVPRT